MRILGKTIPNTGTFPLRGCDNLSAPSLSPHGLCWQLGELPLMPELKFKHGPLWLSVPKRKWVQYLEGRCPPRTLTWVPFLCGHTVATAWVADTKMNSDGPGLSLQTVLWWLVVPTLGFLKLLRELSLSKSLNWDSFLVPGKGTGSL
jgi:hypothetical protein